MIVVCIGPDILVGVYVSEQVPPLRIQAPSEEKVPEPDDVKETVSPLVEPYAPVTVTVHVEGVLTATGLVQLSLVVVVALLTTTLSVAEAAPAAGVPVEESLTL
jgi:hypothetical protein